MENEIPMKTKKLVWEGTAFNDDDHGKRIMDYDLLVCAWNIRSLNRDNASAQLSKALIKCRAGINAIQEMRWIGHGCKSKAHCDILYSCHAERREFVCWFAVGRRLQHLVSGFSPVNERLARIRIKAKFHNISLISAHTPRRKRRTI